MAQILHQADRSLEHKVAVFVEQLPANDAAVIAAWADLARAIPEAHFDGLSVSTGAVLVEPGPADAGETRFHAAGTAYVRLRFADGPRLLETSEMLPARFDGTVDAQGNVQVENITLITTILTGKQP